MPKRDLSAIAGAAAADLRPIQQRGIAGILNSVMELQGARLLPIAQIDHNPHQFRQTFNDDTIRELADSIAQQGLIEPLIVRPRGDRFEIVAGERRLRALRLLLEENNAGALDAIPVIVRDLDDSDAALIIAAENLQREDFTVADESVMYERLINVLGLDPDRGGRELSRRLGIDRNRVNRVRRVAQYPSLVAAIGRQEMTLHGALKLIQDEDRAGGIAEDATAQLLSQQGGLEQKSDLALIEPTSASADNPTGSIPPFTEQHVKAYTRKVPAKAWQPFYNAVQNISRMWEHEPMRLVHSMAQDEVEDIKVKALQAREQLDRLIEAIGNNSGTEIPTGNKQQTNRAEQ